MANNCSYDMLVVGKNRESLERLLKIMQYDDKEFYLYRVFCADGHCRTEPNSDGDEYYTMMIWGDVAWSARAWVHDTPNPNEKIESGAHYSNLQEICKALDIGVEVFTQESGCCFQEHYRVNHGGELTWDECERWEPAVGEDGEVYYEQPGEGGVDGYLEWSDHDDIYG